MDKKSANLFRISTKGLTHFRNKIKPKFHLDFITTHLIPIFSYETAIIMPVENKDKIAQPTDKTQASIKIGKAGKQLT